MNLDSKEKQIMRDNTIKRNNMLYPIETIYDVVDLVTVALSERDQKSLKDLEKALTIVKKWGGIYEDDSLAAVELVLNAYSLIYRYLDLALFKRIYVTSTDRAEPVNEVPDETRRVL